MDGSMDTFYFTSTSGSQAPFGRPTPGTVLRALDLQPTMPRPPPSACLFVAIAIFNGGIFYRRTMLGSAACALVYNLPEVIKDSLDKAGRRVLLYLAERANDKRAEEP